MESPCPSHLHAARHPFCISNPTPIALGSPKRVTPTNPKGCSSLYWRNQLLQALQKSGRDVEDGYHNSQGAEVKPSWPFHLENRLFYFFHIVETPV